MTVRDSDVIGLIRRLGDHYRKNINTKYIKKAFSAVQMDTTTWNLIEDITKEMNYPPEYRADELYERVLALAEFVHKVRKNVSPNLKTLLGTSGSSSLGGGGSSDQEKLMRDIAVSNFSSNIAVLADLVYELYLKTVEWDKRENEGRQKVYERMPELSQIGQYLV